MEYKWNSRDVGRRLWQYVPWLLLLIGIDGFAALLLWIADVEAFRALAAVVVLATFFLFLTVCAVLLYLEYNREQAFRSFLYTPDKYHEELFLKTANSAWAQDIRLLGKVLRENQATCQELQAQLADHEDYVESWAHEIKVPLSLLTLVLDNRREEFSDTVGFKLDYIRNRMQEYISQMLFYARVRGTRKDYLFEHVSIRSCIDEVLEDYHPLLEEKQFMAITPDTDGVVYTDRRGLRFLLEQVISNAIKYSGQEPEICFDYIKEVQADILCIRDNGIGVRSCDLPYIFEKGFTGDSGADRKKATGMGLYLAKAVAKDLNLSLEAISEWGEGFEMKVMFPIV